MRAIVMAGLLGLVASPGLAEMPSGTWGGSYVCGDVAAGMTIEITPEGRNFGSAVMRFFPITPGHALPEGSYAMSVHMREDSGLVTLQPQHWIEQPDPRLIMIGFYGPRVSDRISGEVFNAEGCTSFELVAGRSRQAVAAGPAAQPAPAPAQPAPSAPARPAAETTAPAGDLVGVWALNEMGMTLWTTGIERDFARMIETHTHTATTSAWMRDAGALEIAADGSYRINWVSDKWQGRWVNDPQTGGLLLVDETNRANDWIVFRRPDGGLRAGRANVPMESALAEMTPIADRAVADYLLTPTDPTTLLGNWSLWDGMDMGWISLSADGSYRYEGYYGPIVGTWQVEDEALRLDGFAGTRPRLTADQSVPGQIVVSGGGVQMVGTRR